MSNTPTIQSHSSEHPRLRSSQEGFALLNAWSGHLAVPGAGQLAAERVRRIFREGPDIDVFENADDLRQVQLEGKAAAGVLSHKVAEAAFSTTGYSSEAEAHFQQYRTHLEPVHAAFLGAVNFFAVHARNVIHELPTSDPELLEACKNWCSFANQEAPSTITPDGIELFLRSITKTGLMVPYLMAQALPECYRRDQGQKLSHQDYRESLKFEEFWPTLDAWRGTTVGQSRTLLQNVAELWTDSQQNILFRPVILQYELVQEASGVFHAIPNIEAIDSASKYVESALQVEGESVGDPSLRFSSRGCYGDILQLQHSLPDLEMPKNFYPTASAAFTGVFLYLARKEL
ncbi:MAG: hypothetical protein KDD60_03755 [Bdellovibrionales bacterium]|nr:hypothetical protein [Bdellovibrionales bacterium]